MRFCRRDGRDIEARQPRYPGLEVVAGQIQTVIGEQSHRSSVFDQRGGLILGFGAVLFGLVYEEVTPDAGWTLAGGVLVMVASILGAFSLLPRAANALEPRSLLEYYAAADAEESRFVIMSTLADLFDEQEDRMKVKSQLLTVATVLMIASLPLLLVGAIVDGTPDSNEATPARTGEAPRPPDEGTTP